MEKAIIMIIIMVIITQEGRPLMNGSSFHDSLGMLIIHQALII